MNSQQKDNQMEIDPPPFNNTLHQENSINSQDSRFKFSSPFPETTTTTMKSQDTNQDTIKMNNKVVLPPKLPKRFNSENSQLSQHLNQDYIYYNDIFKKNRSHQDYNSINQDSQSTVHITQNKIGTQTTWQLGDQVFNQNDIKGCFSDKQVFNQANIFTRKHVNDLFDDSDDEVQEEGLVTQIHKRNMQDVYDMTPKDKKFTFLWNEFFIKLEKSKIKEKIPIKRSDIYGYIQQFIEENIEELLNLHPQFVIHLFTMQDNGILDTEQIARSLKYLKDYPIRFLKSNQE